GRRTDERSRMTTTTVSTPHELEIRVERIFDAPREHVFSVWTDPQLIPEWWGDGTVVEEMDVRPGGTYRFRSERGTVEGEFHERLDPLRELGLIDQVAVIDASTDRTAAIARSHGAEVYEQAALIPEFGPVLGKGDAMWRALRVLRGDYVVYLDADSEGFGQH